MKNCKNFQCNQRQKIKDSFSNTKFRTLSHFQDCLKSFISIGENLNNTNTRKFFAIYMYICICESFVLTVFLTNTNTIH